MNKFTTILVVCAVLNGFSGINAADNHGAANEADDKQFSIDIGDLLALYGDYEGDPEHPTQLNIRTLSVKDQATLDRITKLLTDALAEDRSFKDTVCNMTAEESLTYAGKIAKDSILLGCALGIKTVRALKIVTLFILKNGTNGYGRLFSNSRAGWTWVYGKIAKNPGAPQVPAANPERRGDAPAVAQNQQADGNDNNDE